jgi:hypothetical protein
MMLSLAGCVIYLDNPPERTISGQVVREDTGMPLADALILFRSGRKPFSLLPVDTFGIDASTRTDKDGKFLVSAKLNGKVEVTVQSDEFFQRFELLPFPESNRIDGLIWRLKDRKSNQWPQ